MTDQPAAPPPPAAAPPAPAAAPAPVAAGSGLTAAEEATLAGLQARRGTALAGPGAMQMKVEPPHESLTHGGVTVTNEFTSVPASMAAAIMAAADDAGVKITQET